MMIPRWEPQLRRAMAERPDPAARFSWWLGEKANGSYTPGVRLVFLEQPYLGWAEAVEAAIERAEVAMRQQIANEVLNPDR